MFFVLAVSGLAAISAAFYFFKTSKEMPKTWYEWKTEFRFQYIGMVGVSQDYLYRHRNKVGMYLQVFSFQSGLHSDFPTGTLLVDDVTVKLAILSTDLTG